MVIPFIAGLLLVGQAGAEVDPGRRQELIHLLKQDCGSCHGLTLKGGLGPALTPEALAGKDPAMLRNVILQGRPATPMPPWKALMSEPETDWLVQRLQRGEIDGDP
jgi:cytochrome c55X